MLAYVKSNIDFSTKDILEFETYSFSQDIEYADKSSITVLTKPNITDDDFVFCKDGNEVVFIGICQGYSTDESSGYTIQLKQKECFFDRQIFVGTESLISGTGIEDYIKEAIEDNWTASGDTLLDKDYITVVASTHTPVNASVDAENGVYNLKTFLGNAKEYYGIYTSFTYTGSTLTVTISKDNSTSLPIDVTISDVSEYSETYNVDVLAKLIAKWSEYTPLDYIQSSGTQYIDTGVGFADGFQCNIKYAYTAIDNDVDVLGADNTPSWWGILLNSIGSVQRLVTGTECAISSSSQSLVANTDYVAEIKFNGTTQTVYQNGELWNTTNCAVTASQLNLYLFARHNGYGATGQFSKAKVYYCKMYNGSTLVRDFVPAKRNSDGAIGLFDKVNNVFYPNSGTGTFSYGSETAWEYYLKSDRTITTDKTDTDRAKGVVKSVAMSQTTYAEMYQEVVNQFQSNSYEHKITFNLLNSSKAYPPSNYYVGRKASIKTKTGIQTSLITGMSYSSDSSFICFTFGKLKITLLEKIREMTK